MYFSPAKSPPWHTILTEAKSEIPKGLNTRTAIPTPHGDIDLLRERNHISIQYRYGSFMFYYT
jgi:hypothetical protein